MHDIETVSRYENQFITAAKYLMREYGYFRDDLDALLDEAEELLND